jgi:putative redox protein
MHSPLDRVVSINHAEKIYVAAKHPKSFVSLDKADHLLSNKADAEYTAAVIAQWASRYIDGEGQSRGQNDIEPGLLEVAEYNQKFTRMVRSDTHEWLADEPLRVGGEDLGPDPYEHLLAALGTCTSMTIRMYANRKKLQLEDVKVKLSHSRDHVTDCEGCEDQPKKIETLDREISFKGDLSQAEREMLMEIADKCPVHKTLLGEISITSRMAESV